MASAAPALSPTHPDVRSNQQSVSATGVEVSATNGFLFVTFGDEMQQKAFLTGLDEQGIPHTVVGSSIRFTAHNRH